MNEWKRKVSFFLSFYNLFWLFFFLFLHFRFPRCHSFFYSIPIKKKSFIASSFIKPSCCLHHIFLIRYSFLLFSLCLVLFNFFSHSSLQTFLFHSFEILVRCDIVLFFVLPLLILRFPFLKVVIVFFNMQTFS